MPSIQELIYLKKDWQNRLEAAVCRTIAFQLLITIQFLFEMCLLSR